MKQHQPYFKIGSWNIQGLSSKNHDKCTDATFLSQLEDYDIVGLTETHTVEGKTQERPIGDYSTHYFHRPKHHKAPHGSGGIIVLIKPHLRKAIKLFPSKNKDYVWLHIDKTTLGLKQNLYICMAYIPPADSTYSKKLEYDILDEIEHETGKLKSKGDILILGDLNARTSNNLDFIPDDTHSHLPMHDHYTLDTNIHRRQSHDKILDDRGKHVLELCIGHQLRILNGRKLGDYGGYYTCHQYNGSSVVDYGICSTTLLDSIPYFKTHTLIGTVSDHSMISLAIQTHLHILPTTAQQLTDMPTFFKWGEGSSEAFKTALRLPVIQQIINDTHTLMTQHTDTGTVADKFTSALTKAASLSLKLKRTKHKHKPRAPWHTLDLKRMEKEVNKKGRLMVKTQTGEARKSFFLALKRYKKAKKYAKRHFMQTQISKLETLKTEDPKQFWHMLQNLKGGQANPDHASKITPGDWYDYIMTANKSEHTLSTTLTDKITQGLKHRSFNELDFSFTLQEIQTAIQKLKNNKAVGLDLISNEMLKCLNEDSLLCLKNMLNKIYTSNDYPQSWCRGYIVNIHKKGSHFDPQNYRNITITSSLGKLFNLILNNRLQNYLTKHNLISPQQIGFQKDSSTADHVFTLKTIIDKYTQRKSQKLYTCFIDFRQAFDRIWHQGLLYKLMNIGINNNFWNMINSMYSKIELQIKCGNQLTDKFASSVGVRQGDNLSPTLFNIYINDLIQCINKQSNTDPVTIGDKTLSLLLYADDVVIVSTSSTGLQNCINALKTFTEEWKLELNLQKTKTLIFNNKETYSHKFYFGEGEIQCTDKYTYLGIEFDQNCNFQQAINSLQNKGIKAMFKLRQLTDSITNINTLLTIFDHTIKPILLYGSEVWGINIIKQKNLNDLTHIMKDLQDSKLNSLELKFYKQILRVRRNTPTTGVRGELGRHPLSLYAISNSIKYLYSIQIKPEHKLVKQALKESQTLNPKRSWSHLVKEAEHTIHNNSIPFPNPSSKPLVKKAYKSTVRTLKGKYEQYWWEQLTSTQSRTKGRGGNKLRTYNTLKQAFTLEPYLSEIDDMSHRRVLTRLRLSSHNLNIETMRSTNPDPLTRICPMCTHGAMENEEHFTMHCPAYTPERNTLIDTCKLTCPQFNYLTPQDQFIWLMTNEDKTALKAVGKFTWQALETRKLRLRAQTPTV